MENTRIIKKMSGYASKIVSNNIDQYGSSTEHLSDILESLGFSDMSMEEALSTLGMTEEEIAKLGPEALDKEASQEWIRSLLLNDYKKFLSLGSKDINDPNNCIDIVFTNAGERDTALEVLSEVIKYADSVRDRGADYWMKFVDSKYPLENFICRMLIQEIDYVPTWYRKWKLESLQKP